MSGSPREGVQFSLQPGWERDIFLRLTHQQFSWAAPGRLMCLEWRRLFFMLSLDLWTLTVLVDTLRIFRGPTKSDELFAGGVNSSRVLVARWP